MQKLCLSVLLTVSLATAAFAQSKTITNFELEKYKSQRIQADADYDRKVQNGTLPSRAELEKREQERQLFISEFSQKAQIARNQAENFWQAQAYNLRIEIAATEAEINYVRARVSEIPQPQVYYSVGYLPYGYNGYGNCCFGGTGYPQSPVSRTNNMQVNNGQVSGRVTLGGGSSSISLGGGYRNTRIQQNIGINAASLNAPRTNLAFGGIAYQPGILTAPFTLPTPQNLTREELLARLRLLEQQRAGLYARFQVLEDEAQRNGVKVD